MTWETRFRWLFPWRWRIGPLLISRQSAEERESDVKDALRMVANSQMPGPQTPAVALNRLGIADAAVQRCQP